MNRRKILNGIPVTSDDEFWMKTMKEVTSASITSIEDAGKQLIAMITVLEGIYTAVIAFSGVKEIPAGSFWASVFYILPILLWLAALFFALRIFRTRRYTYYGNSPDSAKRTFAKIAERKQRNLDVAYILLTVSFVMAAAGMLYWMWKG